MAELTASQIRDKIKSKLEEAKLQVKIFEEKLAFFDALIREDSGVPTEVTITSEKTTEGATIKRFDDENSVGKAMTDAIRGIDKETIFDVPTIVELVADQFPNLDYPTLSKRASSKLYRFEKRGEIELVKRGYGRSPHEYRRIK